MTTTITPRRASARGARSESAPVETRPSEPTGRRHLLWLAAGFPFAFAVPFVLADTLALDRDLFYGLYALAVAIFVGAWARDTGLGRPQLTRNWRWGLALGALAAALLAFVVVRTEDASDRPEGLEFLGALLWRGVVYGATDGVLLSVFPILAVFGAFAGTRLLSRLRGTIAVGAVALVASLGVTASYHLGYSDFRSAKVGKTAAGDLIWSAPTLLTLSPLGAPLAHVGLHVTAVAHSYDTDLFLPPHAVAEPTAVPAEGQTATADERSAFADTLTALTTGAGRIAPGATAYVRGSSGTWFGAAGIADVAAGRAMRPGDRMRLESVSKIWTAAIVLRLAEEGRLRPDDTVERWLPGLLPDGGRITVAQLLTHTSGLIDNNDMATDPGRFIARVDDAELRAQLTAVAERARTDPALEYPPLLWIRLAAWQPLRFEPGTGTHYSNIGFEVLGLIAARAGGATVAELYDSVLIRPLGLASATYDPQGQIAGPHARGYRMTGEQADATAWHGGIGAEGGVVASAADTGRLLEALLGGRVLSDGWVRRLRGDLFWRGGTQSSCGGAYGHSGGGAGYKAEALVSADGRRVAVLLLNGRGSPADDSRAYSAIWELYCAA
jgi:D-alanyl-D-alanine carboxypeptidase